MKRVRIIVEGATESSFVAGPLRESLWSLGVSVSATELGIQGHKGGRVNYARVKSDILRALKQDRAVYCSTLFDLYRLGVGFPSRFPGKELSGQQRVTDLEQAILDDISQEIPHLRPDVRFIPYIQIYEFEGLLFSDPAALAYGMFREDLAPRLQAIRSSFDTPEDINGGDQTSPSKQILRLCPAYDKVISGTLATQRMGIDVIRQHCPRFRARFERLAAIGS